MWYKYKYKTYLNKITGIICMKTFDSYLNFTKKNKIKYKKMYKMTEQE